MSELLTLAQAAEGATAVEQFDLLGDAWDMIAPSFDRATLADKASRFALMLDAEAWESASLMLVPEGWALSLGEMMGLPPERRWRCHLRDHNEPYDPATCKWVDCDCATPALAIVAASLKARASMETTDER